MINLGALRPARNAVACATAAIALTACANFGAMSPTPVGLTRGSTTLRGDSAGYTFYTVDYPHKQPNRITGIAKNREIVGVYGNNGDHGAYHSFTSLYGSSDPYTQFQDDDYPNASSTYMTSIAVPAKSTSTIQAGYAMSIGDLPGTWGVINNKGLWTLVPRNRGERLCHMMEFFGLNSNYDAVGLFWNDESPPQHDTCSKHTQLATELLPGNRFREFPAVTGADPSATGINRPGLIVGSTNVSGTGLSKGWTRGQAHAYKYWTFQNKARYSTQMYGINDSGVVVGTYKDLVGNWHGFVVYNLFSTAKQPVWNSIDEPLGDQSNTVVSGIDDLGDICGWYTGTDGIIHGFVGIRQ